MTSTTLNDVRLNELTNAEFDGITGGFLREIRDVIMAAAGNAGGKDGSSEASGLIGSVTGSVLQSPISAMVGG